MAIQLQLVFLVVLALGYLNLGAADTQFLDAALTRGLHENAKEALEEIQKRMCKPIPELGLPALDPFEVDHLDIEFDHKLASLKGEINNLKVEGAKTANIPSLNLATILMKFDFHINIQEIHASGDYKAVGTLAGEHEINGAGKFSVVIRQIDAKGKGKFSLWNILRLTDVEVIPSIQEIEINFEDLHPDKEMSVFLNQLINEHALDTLWGLWKDVENDVYDFARKEVEAKAMTLSDIIEGMNKPLLPPLETEVCED